MHTDFINYELKGYIASLLKRLTAFHAFHIISLYHTVFCVPFNSFNIVIIGELLIEIHKLLNKIYGNKNDLL